MLIAIWLGVAAAISGVFRNTGPWYRVAVGSLAWPTVPFLAAGSYYRHRARRRRILSCSKR